MSSLAIGSGSSNIAALYQAAELRRRETEAAPAQAQAQPVPQAQPASPGLSAEDVKNVFETLDTVLRQALIQLQESPSSADAFARTDANGDGAVSQAEFVAGRPADVGEDQAAALFERLDAEGTGSLTRDQFPQGGPPPGGIGGPPPGPPPGQDVAGQAAVSTLSGQSAAQPVAGDADSALRASLNTLLQRALSSTSAVTSRVSV